MGMRLTFGKNAEEALQAYGDGIIHTVVGMVNVLLQSSDAISGGVGKEGKQ